MLPRPLDWSLMVPARPPTPCKSTKYRLPDAEITKGRSSLHLSLAQGTKCNMLNWTWSLSLVLKSEMTLCHMSTCFKGKHFNSSVPVQKTWKYDINRHGHFFFHSFRIQLSARLSQCYPEPPWRQLLPCLNSPHDLLGRSTFLQEHRHQIQPGHVQDAGSSAGPCPGIWSVCQECIRLLKLTLLISSFSFLMV